MKGIPGFQINDCYLIKRYTEELKKVITLDQLKDHVKRWRALWEAKVDGKPEDVDKVDQQILIDVNEEDLDCIKTSFKKPNNDDQACPHIKEKLCAGMEIRIPWSTLVALEVAHKYGVPISTAFHQLFCRDENHISCF